MNIDDVIAGGCITVEIDTREHYPVVFPGYIEVEAGDRGHRRVRVETRFTKLNSGDYRLAQWPKCCGIERKSGQMELITNLFDSQDALRQAKAFTRFASDYRYPYLLLESSYGQLSGLSPSRKITAENIIHRVTRVLADYGMGLLWVPRNGGSSARRYMLGQVLAHLMLSYGLKGGDKDASSQTESR